MEIIAFASGKGGTGKTLTASCLGYALVKAGHRVLLIDGDPATDGLSLFLLGKDGTRHIANFDDRNTFSGVLKEFATTGRMTFEPHRINRVESNELGGHGVSYQVLISGKGLYGDETLIKTGAAVPDLNQGAFRAAIRALFDGIKSSDSYDYVIVDSRGGFGFESTDICALADSFIVVTEPDVTSFYQDRNLVKRISAAAMELGSRPLLRSIIVNKATEIDDTGGELDLRKIETSFRLELTKEFPLKFEDTHPLPVDLEALKAYKTQRMPYLSAPASLFSFATLSAFRDILQVVTAKWSDEQVSNWNGLVESVSGAISKRNQDLQKKRDQSVQQEKEFAALRKQNSDYLERLEGFEREIRRTEERYGRELARSDEILKRSAHPPTSSWLDGMWGGSYSGRLFRIYVLVIFTVIPVVGGSYLLFNRNQGDDLLTKVYNANLPPAIRAGYLRELHSQRTRLDLSGINLTGASLNGLDLSESSFRSAFLRKVSLDNANLTGADFSDADLTNAQLIHANLTNAKLARVQVIGADFSGAILTGADLRGADLRGATISSEQVKSAKVDEKTKFGPDIDRATGGPAQSIPSKGKSTLSIPGTEGTPKVR